MAWGGEVFTLSVVWPGWQGPFTSHLMLGNCGDRVTAQGRGVSPCSDAAMHDV